MRRDRAKADSFVSRQNEMSPMDKESYQELSSNMFDVVMLSRSKARTVQKIKELQSLVQNDKKVSRFSDPDLNTKIPILTAGDETWEVARSFLRDKHYIGTLLAAMSVYSRLGTSQDIDQESTKSIVAALKGINTALEVVKETNVGEFISEYVTPFRIRNSIS